MLDLLEINRTEEKKKQETLFRHYFMSQILLKF